MNELRIKSNEDLKIVDTNHHFRVFAGPGAGKTYLIIENIKNIVRDSPTLNRDRKILCITYTNVAADEIKFRLNTYNEYVFTSTIHSFLYQFIIKPNQAQLKKIFKDMYDIEIPKKTVFKSRIEGEDLLASVRKEDIYQYLVRNESNISEKQIRRLSKRKIADAIGEIKNLNCYPFVESDIEPIITINGYSTTLTKTLKKYIWSEHGLLDFSEILYYSYLLLKKYRHLLYLVRYMFPYIILDEYQDTAPIQHKIVSLISECNFVTIGVVGDLTQSIYSFIGSKYKQFQDFSLKTKKLDTYIIEGNRRSNQNITHFLNYFRQRDKYLTSQECISKVEENNKVIILFSETDPSIFLDIIHEDSYIITRRFIDCLYYIRDISSHQRYLIKNLNNYYTYRLGRNLVSDFSSEKNEWIQFMKFITEMISAAQSKNAAKVISVCERYMDFDFIDNQNEKTNSRFIKLIHFSEKFKEFKDEDTFMKIYNRITDFSRESELDIFLKPPIEDEYIIQNELKLLADLELRTIRLLTANLYTKESKYGTIHRAKGKEYDNVVVDSTPTKNESDENALEQIYNPNIFSEAGEHKNLGEYLRILYVGLSRAKKQLYLYVNGSEDDANKLHESLQKYMKKRSICEPFYEIIYRK